MWKYVYQHEHTCSLLVYVFVTSVQDPELRISRWRLNVGAAEKKSVFSSQSNVSSRISERLWHFPRAHLASQVSANRKGPSWIGRRAKIDLVLFVTKILMTFLYGRGINVTARAPPLNGSSCLLLRHSGVPFAFMTSVIFSWISGRLGLVKCNLDCIRLE